MPLPVSLKYCLSLETIDSFFVICFFLWYVDFFIYCKNTLQNYIVAESFFNKNQEKHSAKDGCKICLV